MVEPQRIQLSRSRGFNLQLHSRALNGLHAIKIDRTTNFGNPWPVGSTVDMTMVKRWGWNISPEGRRHVCKCAAESVAKFAHALLWDVAIHDHVRKKLGGKNLACWCPLEASCHAVPLILVANSRPDEIDGIQAAIDKVIFGEAARILKETSS